MSFSQVPRSIRLGADTDARLQDFSQLTGETTSDLIRRFVADGLARDLSIDSLNARLVQTAERFRAVAEHVSGVAVEAQAQLHYVNPTPSDTL